MNREEIFEKVKAIVEVEVRDLHRVNVQGNSRIVEDLGCDSLDVVEISIELDKTFGINTSDIDIETIENGTVDDIVDMVERILTKKNKKS